MVKLTNQRVLIFDFLTKQDKILFWAKGIGDLTILLFFDIIERRVFAEVWA